MFGGGRGSDRGGGDGSNDGSPPPSGGGGGALGLVALGPPWALWSLWRSEGNQHV